MDPIIKFRFVFKPFLAMSNSHSTDRN